MSFNCTTAGHLFKVHQINTPQRYLDIKVHCSTIYNKYLMEPHRCPTVLKQIDNMAYVAMEFFFSHKARSCAVFMKLDAF